MSKNNLQFSVLEYIFPLIFFTLIIITPVFAQNQKTDSDWTKPLENCWEYNTREMTKTPLASDNNYIFIPTVKSIKAVNTNDGKLIWETDLNGVLSGEILIKDEFLIFTTEQMEKNISFITFLHIKTGIPYKQISLNIYPLILQTVSDKTIVTTSFNRINTIDTNTEKILSDRTLSNKIYSKDFPENLYVPKIVFSISNKQIDKPSTSDGKLLENINLEDIPSYIFIHEQSGSFIIGYKNGLITSIESEGSKKNWNLKLGGEIVDIKDFEKNLIVSSKDNFIYSIKTENGGKNWRTKMPGRIIGNVLINKETLLSLSFGSESAVLINPQNGKLINKLNFEDGTYFISPPIYVKDTVFITTNNGIEAFSPNCGKKDEVL